MESFTPYSALAGGVLIGLAATLLLLVNGRIAGISGILGGVLTPGHSDGRWQATFLAGLLAGGVGFAWLWPAPIGVAPVSGAVLVAAGVLVGFGTRLGSGCTSGHGVCGMSRLSGRSLVATLTFMATAMVTVFLVRGAG